MKIEVHFPGSPRHVSAQSRVGTNAPLQTPFHLIELQALRFGHFILGIEIGLEGGRSQKRVLTMTDVSVTSQ